MRRKYKAFSVCFILLLLNIYFVGYAQTDAKVGRALSRLQVNDTMPGHFFKGLLHYSPDSVNLAALKGKLVILDFWSSYCTSCINAFPKMEALQKQFGGRLQIFLVNCFEDTLRCSGLFNRIKKHSGLSMTLPAICGDTSLATLFPYDAVPMEVWIDETGKIFSISTGDAVNENNINDYFHHRAKPFNQYYRNDEVITYDCFKPLFENGNGGVAKQVFGYYKPLFRRSFSVLARGSIRLFPNDGIVADERGYSVIAVKNDIRDLYRLAYGQPFFNESVQRSNILPLPISRIILKVRDSTRFVQMVNGEFQNDSLYSYQYISFSPIREGELQSQMRRDLDQYIGLKARWEKRKLKCLVLTAKDTDLIKYKKGGVEQWIDDYKILINRISMSYFIHRLETTTKYYYSSYPIIDETGFKGKLGYIHSEFPVGDVQLFNKALGAYSLHLSLEEREIRMLVLTEPDF